MPNSRFRTLVPVLIRTSPHNVCCALWQKRFTEAKRNSSLGGDFGDWAVSPFGDLPERANPVPAALLRQFVGLFNGADEVRERRLQN